MECNIKVCSAAAELHKRKVEELLPLIRPLREESAVCSHVAMTLGRDVRNMERHIYDQKNKKILKHPLDALYDEGGAQYFQHTMWSPEHRPREEEPDELLMECIRAAFPLTNGSTLESISNVLEQPNLKKRIDENGNRNLIEEAFEIFKGIDRWDYDTIQLEIITNGNALFYTTYLLLYKMDLVAYFQMDDNVVRNFLVAVQSAYHPNPYHNAMHGADVTQINYYIMIVAGLREKCMLSQEEVLASIIAGAVHDFDHPGLNNNFHSRTNSFLATLYNDRSILENHHIACTFELLRSPRYDIFAPLNADQKQLVRDTMLEMVLATDMGNHAKIFKNFTVRMSETSDWHSKKDDVRLALSMSIKMADISNCARPNHIYAEWAKNISKEFYLQGDAERKLQLSISPFMDRTKEKEEFPKGQISFMMYIVQPMIEAISEFLPSLSFGINLCNENKDYWRRKQEAGTE
ncbi:3', 5'-cyclic nucleotide phosphodiesterase [Strigomonas culicis]|nr:3', 5'-cyclic nucleotide phosphodiesterase [Strigomonas culicis]|eukprot:EPY37120.1 3', 5'-cyclic nucleotide phosphodiesterase [Strigomonas culicis]